MTYDMTPPAFTGRKSRHNDHESAQPSVSSASFALRPSSLLTPYCLPLQGEYTTIMMQSRSSTQLSPWQPPDPSGAPHSLNITNGLRCDATTTTGDDAGDFGAGVAAAKVRAWAPNPLLLLPKEEFWRCTVSIRKMRLRHYVRLCLSILAALFPAYYQLRMALVMDTVAPDGSNLSSQTNHTAAISTTPTTTLPHLRNRTTAKGSINYLPANVTTLDTELLHAVRPTSNNLLSLSSASSSGTSPPLLHLDEAAPRLVAAVTHYLHSSIPNEMRLPAFRAINKTLLYQDPLLQKRKYVFEFNPSIVVLPDHQRTSPQAAYLASYRVSTQHACYHQERNSIRHRNYIGFAVLDSDLNILQEATVDPSNPLRRVEDFRLFVLRNDLYVASYQSLHRLWIRNPPVDKRQYVTVSALAKPQAGFNGSSNSPLMIYVEKFRRCSRDPDVGRTAKSLTYFTSTNGTIIMEPFPMVDKEVLSDASCDDVRNNASTVPVKIPIGGGNNRPRPSFRTSEEEFLETHPGIRRPALTGDRGSYCCASIFHGDKRYLLGISHLKTRYFNTPAPRNPIANQYFSRFYALESTRPYRVAAQSGKFCLSGPWDDGQTRKRNDTEPSQYSSSSSVPEHYAHLTSTRRLVLGNETYQCPGIHFVSGMTDDAVDPENKLIIAYGVNDCFARLVVVNKSEVAEMLFGR